MWKVYRLIKNKWFLIGDYNTIDAAANIVKHEIYLYNCTCQDGDPNPKFKIESNFDFE